MRHPHGLRAAAGNQGIILPAIGEALEGGFYAGLISHTANSIATHALIVAPRATGATGTSYIVTTNYAWKTASTTTAGTTSPFDGAANTAAMVTAGIASHPAANFCVGLSIDGYSDWYLPSRYELDIAFKNLKPNVVDNNTSWGINPYSVPESTVNHTISTPPQTSATAFLSVTGAERFSAGLHWSSTEDAAALAWMLNFFVGDQTNADKSGNTQRIRAFRRLAL